MLAEIGKKRLIIARLEKPIFSDARFTNLGMIDDDDNREMTRWRFCTNTCDFSLRIYWFFLSSFSYKIIKIKRLKRECFISHERRVSSHRVLFSSKIYYSQFHEIYFVCTFAYFRLWPYFKRHIIIFVILYHADSRYVHAYVRVRVCVCVSRVIINFTRM